MTPGRPLEIAPPVARPQGEQKDGGPAFSCQEVKVHEKGYAYTELHTGMTLRDWFAGMALQGMVANPAGGTANETASSAYLLADAMLAERSKETDQ